MRCASTRTTVGLCRRVARFIHAGLSAAQPGIVVATAAAPRGDCARTRRARAGRRPRCRRPAICMCLEAPGLLETFMVGDQPDPRLSRLARESSSGPPDAGATGATVYVYGEMVDLLWQSGRTAAALRLEVLWSQLAAVESFSLLCGYSCGELLSGQGPRGPLRASHPRRTHPPGAGPLASDRRYPEATIVRPLSRL